MPLGKSSTRSGNAATSTSIFVFFSMARMSCVYVPQYMYAAVMVCRRYGRMAKPGGSRGGQYRVAHDILYGGVVHGTRSLLHRALVAEEYGDVNAWANVAAAPSAEAARALQGQGGVTGKGWRADLSHALHRSGLLPAREKGTETAAAAAARG